MEENYKKEKELLGRYVKGACSPEERLLVEHWFNQQEDPMPDTLEKTDFDVIRNEIWDKLPVAKQIKTYKLWPRIVAAASIVIIACAGLYYYSLHTNQRQSNAFAHNNDIAPGKSGATLTLANGKKIRLTDAATGKLAEEAGVRITKTKDGQVVYTILAEAGEIASQARNDGQQALNTLSTGKGETYRVRLPDGSLVWLNAASSLMYTSNLSAQGKRRVKLEGEGYFEIAKDKKHPFIVESKGQEVQVLGTHFNVNAYTDEVEIRTTLLEGSVKVSQNGQSKNMIPGEQAVNTGNSIQINKADTELATAWKNNKFIFDSQHIEDIMRMIERWYNVEVIYTAKIPDETFWGSVSRFENVNKVLEKLESTEKVHFKVEGRRIYVR